MGDKEALTEADIDTMPPGRVYRTLSEYGVNGDDLSPAEAKTALKQKIRELTEEAEKARSPEQVAEMMADNAESYRANRELLLQRCRDVIAFLPTLDQSDKEKLTLRFRRDVMEILEEVQEHLSKNDCPILVAGETSAGKSTLLNLLLGDDILPVAHLSSTSTICELKYGETRQAVVHLREADPVTESHRITLTLSTEPEECRHQLAPYIHLKANERETLPPASKIEIFWPLPFLKGGVTIVDSPGVGESDTMDDVIARYIPSAFAFIYIIDSSRAGGVQQDRLGSLLLKCREHGAQSELEQFDARKVIFVCNKWDLVPEKERHEVKAETIRKLGEMWNGLDESQVFTHSNTEAEKSGFRSADFTKLLDGIYELLPQSLRHKLTVQYRRMIGILEEALTYVRLKLNNAFQNLDKDERRGAYVRAQTAMSQFDETTGRNIKELKDFIEDATETAVTIMTEISQKGEFKQHLTEIGKERYADDYLPEIQEHHETDMFDICKDESHLTENFEYQSYAEARNEKETTLRMIDYLLRQEQLKDHVKVTREHFEAHLQEMVTRVEHEHDTAIRPVTGQICQLVSVTDRLLPNHLLLFFYPSILTTWVLVRKVKKTLSEFFRAITALIRLSELDTATMATDEMFKAVAEDSLHSSFQLLNDFDSELQAVKDVDGRLVEERFAETRSQMELVSTYQPQESHIGLLLGRLAMVQLGEMREYDFDLDSIIGWPDPQNRIAGGSYGEVYRVQVQRGGESVRAALKVGVYPYDLTTEENAWVFLTEENNLRKLRGEHIVEYFGTAWKKEEGGLRLGLVMELCGGTLESWVIGNREHNPTWWGHDPVMKQRAFSYIQDKAVQLCEGLRTIHDAGYIHRDLKLVNVLVTTGDVVKLTDFGETKREDNATGTMAGTATYAAPEVKERKVYNKSADIYSLGLILWEMWYGRTIWDALEDGSLRYPTEGVPVMMPHSPDSIRPIPEWATLVRDCVNRDASRRPSALECLQSIRSMTMEG